MRARPLPRRWPRRRPHCGHTARRCGAERRTSARGGRRAAAAAAAAAWRARPHRPAFLREASERAQERVVGEGLLAATDRRARHDPPPLGRQGCDEPIRLVAPARRLVCSELVPLVNHQPEPAQPHQRAEAARRPAAARLVQELGLAPLVGRDDDRARAKQVLVGKRRPRLHLWKGEVRSGQAAPRQVPRAIESAAAVHVGEACEECACMCVRVRARARVCVHLWLGG